MSNFVGSYQMKMVEHRWVSYEGLSFFRRMVIGFLGRGAGEWVLVGPEGTLDVVDEVEI